MKVLVTGGTGVIGNGLIPELVKARYQVRLLSRGAAKDEQAYPAEVESFPADITKPDQLQGALNNCACVIHVTGVVQEQPPEITFQNVNVGGTRHLLHESERAGNPLFIYISSLGADRGTSEYHKSKREAENLVRNYSGPWLILRPGNVYGPGDDVISLLLRMVRSLPAIPVIEGGDQPFQPIWYTDLAQAIAQAVSRNDLAGKTFDLAGMDLTNTNDVLDRLGAITGRSPARVPVPAWLAEYGTRAMELFNGMGERALEGIGLEAPLNSAKLRMLLEGSVIENPENNALIHVFKVKPTSLQDGLEILADALPEQTLKEGFGMVEQKRFWADIVSTPYSAKSLLDVFCTNIAELMPMEFAAEPGVPRAAVPGATLTASIPGRGNIQVRLEERSDQTATFLTLKGHPLAGILTFRSEPLPNGVRFMVEIAARASNIFDWAAMHTVGRFMQNQNWRNVVRRVVEVSGGTAPGGVQAETRPLAQAEVEELEKRVESLIQQRKKSELKEELASPQS